MAIAGMASEVVNVSGMAGHLSEGGDSKATRDAEQDGAERRERCPRHGATLAEGPADLRTGEGAILRCTVEGCYHVARLPAAELLRRELLARATEAQPRSGADAHGSASNGTAAHAAGPGEAGTQVAEETSSEPEQMPEAVVEAVTRYRAVLGGTQAAGPEQASDSEEGSGAASGCQAEGVAAHHARKASPDEGRLPAAARCAEWPHCDRRPMRGAALCGCCLRAQREGFVVSWCQTWETANVRAEHRPAPPLVSEDRTRNQPARLPGPSAFDRLFE